MFTDASTSYTFGDTVKIVSDRRDSGTICIRDGDEIFSATTGDKQVYANGCGEYVIELSGLGSIDKNENRSWALAYYDPRGYSRKHYHKIGTETYYVLSGVAQVILNGQTRIVRAGEQITIEPGQHHQVEQIDSDPQLIMAVKCVPAWVPVDQYFVDDPSQALADPADPIVDPKKPSLN